MYTWFWWGNLRERAHLEDPGLDGKNIQIGLQEVGCGGMDWIEDRNRCRALVSAVMNIRVP